MDYFSFSILSSLLLLLIIIWLSLKFQLAAGKVSSFSIFQKRSLLLLKFPKEEKDRQLAEKNEIRLCENFFNLLNRFNKLVVFEVAVHHVGEDICFYLVGDKKTLNVVGHQIQMFWPGVQMSVADDYDIFNPQGFNEEAYIKLAHDFSLPIKTYEDFNADTFAPFLAILSRLEEIGEGASLQIALRPAPNSVRRKITDKRKLAKPLFKVNLRLAVSAASQFRVKDIFDNLTGNFSKFSNIRENEFKIIRPKDIKKFHFNFSFREFDEEETMILNSEELASVFHFPVSSTFVPRIKWLKTKETKPPVGISKRGIVIGENVFRGRVEPIYLDYTDRAYHLEIIGQAGTGKSSSVINMAIQDIKQNKGVAIVDPEGDIIEAVLGNIPKERMADVIYLDPTDIWHPFGLNLLEFNPSRHEDRTFVIEEAHSIFQKLFAGEKMGPMFERYLKNSLRLLLTDDQTEPITLIDIPKIFIDHVFRKKKLQQAVDRNLISFWKDEVGLHEITPFIISKFNNLIANDYLRPIIGQGRSAFDFRKAMDGEKIILVNLAKSRLGEANANLLGMIFVEKIALAALSRIDQIEEQRKPFYLYLDEFHKYVTDSLAFSLASIFKYGLHLNVIHRSVDELSPALINLINNFGSIVVFRTGLDDAQILIDKFEPSFSVNDLIGMDNFNASGRILVKGNLSQPFSLRIMPPPAADSVLAQEIKNMSRNVYNQNRQKVEMEIYERFNSR